MRTEIIKKNYTWYEKYAPAEYFSEIIILILKVTDTYFEKRKSVHPSRTKDFSLYQLLCRL